MREGQPNPALSPKYLEPGWPGVETEPIMAGFGQARLGQLKLAALPFRADPDSVMFMLLRT